MNESEGGRYNLEEAQEEAEKLQQKIGSGEAKDYQEAEEQVDQETKEAEQQVFRLAMEGDIRGALHFRDEHQLKISDSDIAQSLIEAGKGDLVAENLSNFQGLDHKDIAERLIDTGQGWAVAHYLSNFQGLDHKYIAEKLIEAGKGAAVARHLSKFQGLDHKYIAERLIDDGECWTVAMNLSNFQGLDSHIAEKLIGARMVWAVAKNLSNFQGLDSHIAEKLIDARMVWTVAENLSKFQGLDHKYIAERLIGAREVQAVAKNLSNFQGLDSHIAEKLIGARMVWAVAKNLSSFQGLDSHIAEKLIDAGEVSAVAHYLSNFQGLDSHIAERLIGAGEGRAVAENLSKFQGLDSHIAEKLIGAGEGRAVAENLSNFQGLDSHIAEELIGAGEGRAVAENLSNFQGLDSHIAERLIDAGYHLIVAINLYEFQGLDTEVAEKLIEAGQGEAVAKYLSKFEGLNTEVAEKLIEAGQGEAVAKHLSNFEGLNTEVAEKLIGAGYHWAVAINLSNFQGLDSHIAERLINAREGWAVAENLYKFQGLNTEIAEKLIKAGYLFQVVQYAQRFEDRLPGELLANYQEQIADDIDIADAIVENFTSIKVDQEQAFTLLQACANHYTVAQKIKDLDLLGLVGEANAKQLLEYIANIKPKIKGVLENNPYAEIAGDMQHATSTVQGTEAHRRAVEINRMIRERSGDFAEVAQTIESKIQKLKDRLASQFGEKYARRMVGRVNEFGSIWSQYRRLVADYIALSEAQKQPVDVSRALDFANERFLQVLNVDVNYYEKLYLEFDAKRIGQRTVQEVFLGRDGVYAYIGRNAQIAARRFILTRKGKKQELPEPPTYLVYPRNFISGLDPETKRIYLNQNIRDAKHALYFDTGYRGSIAEDILSILGISREEWDKMIRLLSAEERNRTILGLEGSESERDQIVDTIEHNAKDENSAEGLYIAEGKEGETRLFHYAEPTAPLERLAFRFCQMAISRHFYFRELKNYQHEFTTHKINDSLEMRISTDESAEMRDELIEFFNTNDIGANLLKRAKALKIADANSPYPNEAVFELKIAGKTVIIKNVVLEKQQGPIDEFEALLLLKKLGIDAPKPVARIFTEGQQGFIILERIEGIPGRKIKEYFEAQSVSADNQKNILQDALERMRNIAETIRRDVGFDKPWRLKDFMIEFSTDKNGRLAIKSMKPLDFERAVVFNPESPCSIELGQDLDELIA